jgi:hypothetical protein
MKTLNGIKTTIAGRVMSELTTYELRRRGKQPPRCCVGTSLLTLIHVVLGVDEVWNGIIHRTKTYEVSEFRLSRDS